jgi:transketolase
VDDVNGPDYVFRFGKAVELVAGTDITVMATGGPVCHAVKAAALLKREGISAAVVNIHTIKPIDTAAIMKYAQATDRIVTVEDHNVLGGLGSTVAEIVCRDKPVPVEMVGIHDRFGESGELRELMEIHGLTANHIADAVKRVMKLKDSLD